MSSTESDPGIPRASANRIGKMTSINGSLNLPFEILQATFLKGNRSRGTIAKLSRVCRLWRSIINQSVELWTTIRPFSRNSKDAFRRIEWLVQRTLPPTNGRGQDGRTDGESNGNGSGVLLDIIWDANLYTGVDLTVIAAYFLRLAPPTRWRSLNMYIGTIHDVEALEQYRFDNLEEIAVSGSWAKSINTQNRASTIATSASPLKMLRIRQFDAELFTNIIKMKLIGPQTQVHFECLDPSLVYRRDFEQYRPFFGPVRHLRIVYLSQWIENTVLQHITHLHIQYLNPFMISSFQLSSLRHLSIDSLYLYVSSSDLTIHLPSVEVIELRTLQGDDGRICQFDAPSLQKLHIGRPERRVLGAFRKTRYSHLTLDLHTYWEKALQLVRPYFGQLSSLHLICGALSFPLTIFPLFNEERDDNVAFVGPSLRLRISVRRRRLVSDGSMLEEPARRFHNKHSLDSTVIDWKDGSELSWGGSFICAGISDRWNGWS